MWFDFRDAQILEKDVIGRELTEEEKRLDAMMEHERQRQIKLQEEYELIKKQKQLEWDIYFVFCSHFREKFHFEVTYHKFYREYLCSIPFFKKFSTLNIKFWH